MASAAPAFSRPRVQPTQEHPTQKPLSILLLAGLAIYAAAGLAYALAGLAARQFPYFPVRWLLRDRYDSSRYAPRITAPTLLITAEHDEIIPAASSAQLLAGFAPGIATARLIQRTGHNSISDSAAYGQALQWAR